jgi:putative transposon-encoded protein
MRRKETITRIEAVVRAYGSGAHVLVPKQWLNKKVIITLRDPDAQSLG